MAANIDVHNRMFEILKKPGALTDEEIEELRRLFSQPNSLVQSHPADFRMNIEIIAAIRTFDKASAALIITTNKLTNRILILTYVVVGLGLISAIPAVLHLFRFH